ncbi:hypothetical protein JD844_028535 [Phrynosoma platyrhinos]|uniref:CWH43-like N-terminal domain-containing protein n=1 Tax=Phrynosoma platyrhinos TaxID=52577 RepID=A0ABQ7SI56_PHRPL|nr:hypothetical protein JD844_028535 [Phrynosoma platyrhinos]
MQQIDTGAKPPESGIFGFMINGSAFLGAVTMYVRYLIVKKQNEITDFISPSCNVLALCVGLLGCIGMCIVASFQELTVPAVHDGGALVAFVSGALYILIQTVISYRSCPQWSTPCTCHTRLFISIMTSIAIIPSILFGMLLNEYTNWLYGLGRLAAVIQHLTFLSLIACASLISITKIDWNPGEKVKPH